jgi:choline-glycine betaine transporter
VHSKAKQFGRMVVVVVVVVVAVVVVVVAVVVDNGIDVLSVLKFATEPLKFMG